MHPEQQYLLAQLRLADDARRRDLRHGLPGRPRPPGRRVRSRAATLLVRVAARLTDEPLVVVPRRT
jgi:hypothetical protein